jgi:hypothetical protein
MSSPNLAIPLLTATQRFKETTMNQAIDMLDSATNGRLVLAFTQAVVSVSRSGGVVTAVLSQPHQLALAMPFTLSGVTDTSYNGSFTVASIVSPTNITWAQTGATSTSTGGSIQVTAASWVLNVAATTGALLPQATGYFFYDVQGALTQNTTIVVPLNNKQYVVRNATTGAYTLTVIPPTGTGIAVPQGHVQKLFCDGTNVIATDAYV